MLDPLPLLIGIFVSSSICLRHSFEEINTTLHYIFISIQISALKRKKKIVQKQIPLHVITINSINIPLFWILQHYAILEVDRKLALVTYFARPQQ